MATTRIDIEGNASSILTALKQVESAMSKLQTSATQVNRSLSSITASADRMGTALQAAFGIMAGRGLFDFIDGLQNMENKLRVSTRSQEEFNTSIKAVKEISDKTGQSMSAIADLYSKAASNADKLGYSTNQVTSVTYAFATALQVSGASAQGSAAALYQFGQVLNKGKLNGDEFTTMTENLSGNVLNLLIRNMGITRQQFEEFKTKGLVGAKDFTDALIRSMDQLAAMQGKIGPTVGQSLNRIQNAFASMIIDFERSTGIFRKVADAMTFLSKNIDSVVAGMAAIAVVFTVGRFVAIAAEIRVLAKEIGILGAVMNAVGKSPMMLAITGLVAGFMWFQGKKALGTAPEEASTLEQAMAGAKEETSATAQQLTGIGDQLKNILRDLDEQSKILIANNAQYKIEEEVLKYNKQLGYQLNEQQKEKLRLKLQEVEATKEIIQLGNNLELPLSKALLQYKQAQLAMDKAQAEARKQGKTGVDLGSPIAKGTMLANTNLQKELLALTNRGEAERFAIETKYGTAKLDMAISYAQNRRVLEQMGFNLTIATKNLEMQKEMELYNLKIKLMEDEVAKKATLYAMDMSNRDAYFLKTIGGEKAVQEAAKQRAEFEQKTLYDKTQIGIEQGAQLFSALGAQNKKAFEAAKALNIASAIMNTYASVTKALAAYPWPFSLIPAGAALAMGMAQVAQIRAQNYSGRALGGPVTNNNPYIVGERGPELFVPTNNGSIIPNNQLGEGGGATINFNIQANDAQGFDDLLIQRRGMITQFVRDAMQESGQRSRM